MELDKTAIVISQRSITDIVDLSLIVVRHYFRSLLLFSLIGVLPFALLNLLLTWPLTQYDYLEMTSPGYVEAGTLRTRYYWIMTGAVFLQAPLAFCFVTNFIGQSVFVEKPSFRQVVQVVLGRWFSLALVLGILRMGLLSYLPLTYLFFDSVFRPEIELLFYFFLMVTPLYFVRMFRPFAPELLVLEQCPLRKITGPREQRSYWKRSQLLHSTLYNDTLGAHFFLSFVAALTTLAFCFGAIFVLGVLAGIWSWGMWMDLFVYPACLWTVGAWMAINRFLLYMNSRIRTEGWEVELRFKAEAERLREALS